MIWILANRGVATKLRVPPHTETPIEGVHSVVYKPGVEPVAEGIEAIERDGPPGTYSRGLNRIRGYVFSYHGLVAETLFAMPDDVDLVIRYRAAGGQHRKRTISEVLFVGDATVTVPPLNSGVSELIGVPFRVQIPFFELLEHHVLDEPDE